MPTQCLINYAEAVALHKAGRHVKSIAAKYGVKVPAIYRAFKNQGYETPNMHRRNNPPLKEGLFPPPMRTRSGKSEAARLEDAPAPVYRDPCHRCGARGDYPCGHAKGRMGWNVG